MNFALSVKSKNTGEAIMIKKKITCALKDKINKGIKLFGLHKIRNENISLQKIANIVQHKRIWRH